MNGRRTAVGFSLLCALLVCAFAAQSATATIALNTTAVTCTEGGTKDFTDAHCDNKGEGKFGHAVLEKNQSWGVNLTNAKTKNNTTESTSAILKGTTLGTKMEITCKTVTGSTLLRNFEVESKSHTIEGNGKIEYSSCTVNKPSGCTVVQPITTEALILEGVEGLGTFKNEMGLEFKPKTESTFIKLIIQGCFWAKTYEITGTAIGTGTPAPTEKFTGATTLFTNAMTKETLKLEGNPAEIPSSTTAALTGSGAPVAFTTAT